jgi:YHS domain-containing protein
MKTLSTLPFLCISLALFFGHISSLSAQSVPLKHQLLEDGVALQGYDAVSYFAGKPLKGSSNFAVKYDGAIYYFANASNQTAFKQNAAKFAPAYGGYCAYAIGANAEKVVPNPTSYKIVNGKLNLFVNNFFVDTLKRWNADEANLKNKATKNWANIVKS